MVVAMDLKTFLSPMTQAERDAFAKRCGTSRGHLQNVAYGKTCAPALATAIEIHSARKVTRRDMRPDDWRAIWPELADKRKTARA
jgi:DNA-binding transcriptional regulator YdaS (Cro superfamily)